MSYYSDSILGKVPQSRDVIGARAWRGIRSAIERRLNDGSFAKSFPENCRDSPVPVGVHEGHFFNALNAEMRPSINWSGDFRCEEPDSAPQKNTWEVTDRSDEPPPTLAILDLIQFCYRHVVRPVQDGYHSYYRHYHLRFEVEEGRRDFREKINLLFERNGIAYELKEDGTIERNVSEVLNEALPETRFDTGNSGLDSLLATAVKKFHSPEPATRREGLEKLWDAWERAKTLESGDKRASITALLDQAASEPNFRKELEEEARRLNKIGNNFHIRHTETNQTPLKESDHVDYLFHRLFALIDLILRQRG